MTIETLAARGVQVDTPRSPACGSSPPGAIRGNRRRHRARPLERGAVPRRGPDRRRLRHDHRLAGADHAGRARARRHPAAAWARRSTVDGGRAHGHRRRRGGIHGVDLDLSAAGELAPTLVALAALADAPTTIHGIGHIRGHETDRLAALAAEINAPRRRGSPNSTTASASSRARCTAAAGAATHDHRHGDDRRAHRSRRRRASRSTTSARRPRRCPSSPSSGTAMLADDGPRRPAAGGHAAS